MDVLDAMSGWIEDAPPQPQKAQRFGNLAFRTYIALVEEVCQIYQLRVPCLLSSAFPRYSPACRPSCRGRCSLSCLSRTRSGTRSG
jgi:hypothetical protein